MVMPGPGIPHKIYKDTAAFGNLYIISIGIDHYPRNNFQYCVSDARKIADFFSASYKKINGTAVIQSFLLLDKDATLVNIDSVFRQVSRLSKPKDIFIFYFAGMSYSFNDSLSKGTYFFPYDTFRNIYSREHLKFSLSLKDFRNRMELIKAQNQLIITESGPNQNFFHEFMTALMDKDPLSTILNERNRIIITTNGFGLDNAFCANRKPTEGGPMTSFILRSDSVIFDLFKKDDYEHAKFCILKSEYECLPYKSKISGLIENGTYTTIFSEKEMIRSLKLYKELFVRSRGAGFLEDTEKETVKDTFTNYALVIGTGKFDGKPDWSDLANPEIDARDIAEELKTGYGFKTELVMNPTKNKLTEYLLYYKNHHFTENDNLFIFIAGHGFYDPDFSDGFIVTKDSRPLKQDLSRDSYLQFATINRIIDNIPCKHIFFVLDVCFGGKFGELSPNAGTNRSQNIYDDKNPEEFIMSKMKYKTRLFMASGEKEVPDGYAQSHSPFTRRFLEALRNYKGTDNILTISALFSMIEKSTTTPILKEFGSNEPGSDFLFIPLKR